MDLDSYRLFLIRKGLKRSTIDGDCDILNRLAIQTDLKNIDTYLLRLVEEEKKHSYLNNIVKALRNYGAFTDDEKLKNLPFFKKQDSIKSTMRNEEINDFLGLTPLPYIKGSYLWHYNKMTLFWQCMAFSGARTGEIAKLTVDNVDFGSQVFVVNGKMGQRKIPISPALIQPIKEHYKTLIGKQLFPAMRNDRPIERATWDYDFRQRLKRMGIKRENLTPYSLRHSFITRNWRNMSLPELQKIAGHRRIETTAHYTHLVTEDMVDAIKTDKLGKDHLEPHEVIKQIKEAITKCGVDPRFSYQLTDKGYELLFKIELLEEKI